MDATHSTGNTHDNNLNDPPSEIQGKPYARERVLAAWRALTTKKAALVAVVSAVLLAGAAYAATVYWDKE